jgi:hypothetical protein
VRFVFLSFLDRAVGRVQIVTGGKALDRLARQVAVGHGVANDRDLEAVAAEKAPEPAGRLRLAAPGADRGDRDHRDRGGQHGAIGPQQQEVGPGRQRPGGRVHDRRVGHVAVGEDHVVDPLLAAQRFQLRFRHDRDSVGIARPGQGGRIAPLGNARDLRRGEGDDPGVRIVAINQVEIMEVPSRRTHDHGPLERL